MHILNYLQKVSDRTSGIGFKIIQEGGREKQRGPVDETRLTVSP